MDQTGRLQALRREGKKREVRYKVREGERDIEIDRE
jgi:hypothetical protein